MPRKTSEDPEVIREPFHAHTGNHVRSPPLHARLRLQALERVDTVQEGLKRGLVKVYLESYRTLWPWTAHKSLRILLLFITLWPLAQYLDKTRLIDPTVTGWQNEPLVNFGIALGFYLGLSGLKDLYSKLSGAE